MRQAGFEYIVKAGIVLSREELDVLIELATGHYDSVCQSVAVPGKGAFLNGMLNDFLFAEQQGESITEATVHLTQREIDTLLKVLESRPQLDLAERVRMRKVGNNNNTGNFIDAIARAPLGEAHSSRRQIANQLDNDLRRAMQTIGDEWRRLNA